MNKSYNVDLINDKGQWQTVQITTHSGSIAAMRQAERMAGGRAYDAKEIRSNVTSSTSSMQMPNVGGSGALLGLLMLLVAAVWALPWVMSIGGVLGGHWVMSKVFGKTLGQAMDEDKVKLVALMVITCTFLGATGYVQGSEWKQQLISDPVPEQIAEPATAE